MGKSNDRSDQELVRTTVDDEPLEYISFAGATFLFELPELKNSRYAIQVGEDVIAVSPAMFYLVKEHTGSDVKFILENIPVWVLNEKSLRKAMDVGSTEVRTPSTTRSKTVGGSKPLGKESP